MHKALFILSELMRLKYHRQFSLLIIVQRKAKEIAGGRHLLHLDVSVLTGIFHAYKNQTNWRMCGLSESYFKAVRLPFCFINFTPQISARQARGEGVCH